MKPDAWSILELYVDLRIWGKQHASFSRDLTCTSPGCMRVNSLHRVHPRLAVLRREERMVEDCLLE